MNKGMRIRAGGRDRSVRSVCSHLLCKPCTQWACHTCRCHRVLASPFPRGDVRNPAWSVPDIDPFIGLCGSINAFTGDHLSPRSASHKVAFSQFLIVTTGIGSDNEAIATLALDSLPWVQSQLQYTHSDPVTRTSIDYFFRHGMKADRMFFLDETAIDATVAERRRGWGEIGAWVHVNSPLTRAERHGVMAILGYRGDPTALGYDRTPTTHTVDTGKKGPPLFPHESSQLSSFQLFKHQTFDILHNKEVFGVSAYLHSAIDISNPVISIPIRPTSSSTSQSAIKTLLTIPSNRPRSQLIVSQKSEMLSEKMDWIQIYTAHPAILLRRARQRKKQKQKRSQVDPYILSN
ncbi:hypothetical protein ADUPG1_012407 [Aduncisulcus paluster]|uniref:Uncharacterized protein n=1 Tax=Aduncisulcus paluster TaxID=2918883 RepID=A0ABQ5JZC5_9EUKA|nr:hypothetical protein ADUPG1_012407 [Aduncisulcus paluster]